MKSTINSGGTRSSKQKEADAKWRASIASCYETLKHVVREHKKENRSKVTKATILSEAIQHIHFLENLLDYILKEKASIITLDKSRSEKEIKFSSLDAVKEEFVQIQKEEFENKKFHGTKKFKPRILKSNLMTKNIAFKEKDKSLHKDLAEFHSLDSSTEIINTLDYENKDETIEDINLNTSLDCNANVNFFSGLNKNKLSSSFTLDHDSTSFYPDLINIMTSTPKEDLCEINSFVPSKDHETDLSIEKDSRNHSFSNEFHFDENQDQSWNTDDIDKTLLCQETMDDFEFDGLKPHSCTPIPFLKTRVFDSLNKNNKIVVENRKSNCQNTRANFSSSPKKCRKKLSFTKAKKVDNLEPDHGSTTKHEGYSLFYNQMLKEFQDIYCEETSPSACDMNFMIHELWKNLSEEEKQKYDMSAKLKDSDLYYLNPNSITEEETLQTYNTEESSSEVALVPVCQSNDDNSDMETLLEKQTIHLVPSSLEGMLRNEKSPLISETLDKDWFFDSTINICEVSFDHDFATVPHFEEEISTSPKSPLNITQSCIDFSPPNYGIHKMIKKECYSYNLLDDQNSWSDASWVMLQDPDLKYLRDAFRNED